MTEYSFKRFVIFGSLNYPKLEDVEFWVRNNVMIGDQIIVQPGTRVSEAAISAARKKGVSNFVLLKPRVATINPALAFDPNKRAIEFGGRVYGMFREMLSRADKVVIFWDGESHGAKYLLDMANQQKMETISIKIPTTPTSYPTQPLWNSSGIPNNIEEMVYGFGI